MRPRDLANEDVEGLDPDVGRIEGEDPANLASGHAAQLGNDHLDHEASSGLELVRNSELHATEVAHLREHARFGVPSAGTRLVLHWPHLEDLPDEYRTRQSGEPRTRGEARDAYQKWVADRPVIETLLDAIAFFEALAPNLTRALPPELVYAFVEPVPLGSNGERFVCRPLGLDQFAIFLPDLACRNTERRASSWPSADEWLREENRKIRKKPPAASSREITTRVEGEHGKLIAYSGLSGSRGDYVRSRWIERAKQVGRDVRAGYRYFVQADDFEVDVIADQQLAVTAPSSESDELLAVTSDGSDSLMGFLELLERNPDLYRRERLVP